MASVLPVRFVPRLVNCISLVMRGVYYNARLVRVVQLENCISLEYERCLGNIGVCVHDTNRFSKFAENTRTLKWIVHLYLC